MLSTIDLLVLPRLDQLLLILKLLFTFFAKQATLTRRSTVLNLPPKSVFPGWDLQHLGSSGDFLHMLMTSFEPCWAFVVMLRIILILGRYSQFRETAVAVLREFK
jgi:hypothetical protein